MRTIQNTCRSEGAKKEQAYYQGRAYDRLYSAVPVYAMC